MCCDTVIFMSVTGFSRYFCFVIFFLLVLIISFQRAQIKCLSECLLCLLLFFFYHLRTLCMLDNLSCFCCHLQTFFKIKFFKKFFHEHLECQTVWTQIKTGILSVVIRVQTVCQGYQLTTKVSACMERINFTRAEG